MICESCGAEMGRNENSEFKEEGNLLRLCCGCVESAYDVKKKYGNINWESFKTARGLVIWRAMRLDKPEDLLHYDVFEKFLETYDKLIKQDKKQ